MDKDKLIQRLMTTFLEELEEHVGTLNRDLLALEKEADVKRRAELLQTLFRTAHSLKGASRSVNVGLVESACHQLEEILEAARDGAMVLGPDLFALLFGTADAIEEAGMRLREQQDLSSAPLAAILPRLEAAASRSALEAPRSAVAPADPPRVPARAAKSEPVAAVKAEREKRLPKPDPKEWEGEAPAEPVEEARQGPRPPTSRPPSKERPAEAAPEPAQAATVRVAADKLDAFLARNGELLVARRRVQSRAEDLTALREQVAHWAAEWRGMEKALGKWLERDGPGPHGSTALREPASEGLRVPRRVGAVLGQTGDRLRHLEKGLDRLAANMAGDYRQLKQAADALEDEVRRVRMLPFADACQGLDRMVRDLAQAVGKEVELVVEGGAVELDRSVLEGLKDPLRHLVRNAVDHGAEPPDKRRKAGKPPQARIVVTAVFRGSQVEVSVADDGRGIDREALREQLRRKGLPEPADDRELMSAIFRPGFSTARIITDVSGRGVGLDVVKSRVEALHGTVELTSVPGQGTRFTLGVPLTLTTLRALLVEAGGQTFALAGTNVQKLVRISADDLVSVAGREMLALGEVPLPVASLAETLGLTARESASAGRKKPTAIVAAGEKRMAFVVDELLAEQEIVIKNLGARVRRARQISGATILPSGRIALVLNAANLIRGALGQGAPVRLAALTEGAAAEAKKRILVADDSVTTRTLEKSILEAAGYEVVAAADGQAAWELLQDGGADLVVSDVDMPRMDGFSLADAVRRSKRFAEVPVVLVTARESEGDKARGAEVGANAYLVKSAFDQKNLLETIAQLL